MGWDEDNADRISATTNEVLFARWTILPKYCLAWVRCRRCGKRFFGTKRTARRLTEYLEHVRDTCPWARD